MHWIHYIAIHSGRDSSSQDHQQESPGLVSLGDLPPSARGLVRRLGGGQAFAARAASLGFVPGAEILMLQNFGHGPLIVAVRDTRLALGRGEAVKILVESL